MKVRITTNIRKVVASGPSKFNLDYVKVVPNVDGGVFVVASDGHCAVVVAAEGDSKDAVLVPSDLMPPSDLPVTIEGDDKLRSDKGRTAKPGEGRFPDFCSISPIVDQNYRAVGVDVLLLTRVAAALGTKCLILLVPEANPHTGYVGNAIPIIPDDKGGIAVVLERNKSIGQLKGFGLAMPLTQNWNALTQYNQFRKLFAKSEG